jgi:hypothetical protein
MGKAKTFDVDTSRDEIPKFLEEHNQSKDKEIVCGMYGY